MARMIWDDVGERFYETGVEQCALYLYDKYEPDKTKCYHDGVPWNGLTGVSEKPSGAEPTDLWANDGKYLTMISAEKFAASIEAYTWPEEFNECDGVRKIGSGLKVSQQTRRKFGLAYKSLIGNDEDGTDLGYKIHLIYGCLCSPSEKARKTVNDSPEAMTFTWEISTTPVPVNIPGYRFKATSYLEIDSRDFTGEKEAKLQMLEDILYGFEEFNGVLDYNNFLPLPDEVNTILAYDPELISLRIYTKPFKTKYKIGETLDIDGITVLGKYNISYGEIKTEFESVISNDNITCSGFDSSTVGEKTVTVSFKGKTTTFTVWVEEEPGPGPEPTPKKLVAIQIQQAGRDSWVVGDVYSPGGNPGEQTMYIQATYDDGSIKTDIGPNQYAWRSPDMSEPNPQAKGEVMYTEDDITLSLNFYVAVHPAKTILIDVNHDARQEAAKDPTILDGFLTYPLGVDHDTFRDLIATQGGTAYYGVKAMDRDFAEHWWINIHLETRADCQYYTDPKQNIFDLSQESEYGKIVYLVYKGDRTTQIPLEIAVKAR